MAVSDETQKRYDEIFAEDPFKFNDPETLSLYVGREGPLTVELLISPDRVANGHDGTSVILSADEAWKLHAWLEAHITYRPRVV